MNGTRELRSDLHNTFWIQSLSPEGGNRPYERSFKSLLGGIRARIGADGCYLYDYSEASRELSLRYREGPLRTHPGRLRIEAPADLLLEGFENGSQTGVLSGAAHHAGFGRFPEVISEGYQAFYIIPLRASRRSVGAITIGYSAPREPPVEFDDGVKLLANGLASLLADLEMRAQSKELLKQLSELEIELLDAKIAERSEGLAAGGEWHKPDTFSTIASHVTAVLGQPGIRQELEARIADARNQRASRRLLRDAKQVLQEHLSMTEEQAYIFLRSKSRSARLPLAVIAQEVLESASRNTEAKVRLTA